MRIAFLADIHSNLLALEAVKQDLDGYAPDAVYLLGDQVNRCPWPNQVMDFIVAQGWPAIYGNHDLVVGRMLTADIIPPFQDRVRFPCLWWTAETLNETHRERLRALPAEIRVATGCAPALRLVHGVPGNSFAGFYPEIPAEQALEHLSSIAEPIVMSAHTHRPLARQIGRWQLFNPGSVGMPYNEDPRAQYLLLDEVKENGVWQWEPNFRRVDYDRAGLTTAFKTSGMFDAIGITAELHLRTVLTGHAYSSDYGYWLKDQPRQIQLDPDRAVQIYLSQHGPGHWAFSI